MFTCRHTTELASQYLEGEVSGVLRLRFRLHLFICGNCRRYLSQMLQTRRMLSRLAETPPQDKLETQLVDTFRAMRSLTTNSQHI